MTPASRLIQYPSSPNIFGKGVILVDLLLLSIMPFSIQISSWAAGAALLLAAVSILARDVQSFHLSLFTAVLIAVPWLHPALRSWPYALLIPLLFYGIVVLSVPTLRRSLLWLHAGTFDRKIVMSIAVIAAVSGVALCIWYFGLKPDVSIQLRNMPGMPALLFPVAGLAFAAGNAALEEFSFRGIIMQSTDSAFGPGWSSILIQAWLFGAMHFLQGFPRGWWGLAMSAGYGIMLGILRRRSRGMLAPWAAHVSADIVIFSILAGIVLKG